jgi:uncharacterized protein YjbI with pentapeptide repeats
VRLLFKVVVATLLAISSFGAIADETEEDGASSGDAPLLVELSVFDSLGILLNLNLVSGTHDVAQTDSLHFNLNQFRADPKSRAFSDIYRHILRIANAEGQAIPGGFCAVIREIVNEVDAYDPPMAAIRAGRPRDTPSIEARAEDWRWDGALWLERFRLHRAIADDELLPGEVREVAESLIRLEWTMLMDRTVLTSLSEHCDAPGTSFRFNGSRALLLDGDHYEAAWSGHTELQTCTRPDVTEAYWLSFPYIDRNLVTLLAESGVKNFEISCATADFRHPYATLGTVRLDGVLLSNVDLTGATLNRLHLRNVRVEDVFTLEDAIFSGQITLEHVATGHPALFDRLHTRSDIQIANSEFGALIEEKDHRTALSFFGADVDKRIYLNLVTAHGNIHFGTSKIDHLRLVGINVRNDLNMWGAEIAGAAFIGTSQHGVFVHGNIEAWYLRAADLQLTNALVLGDIILNDASISGAIYAGNAYAGGSVHLDGARAESADLSRLVADEIHLRSADFSGPVTMRNVATSVVNGFELGAAYLGVNFGVEQLSSPTKVAVSQDLSGCLPILLLPDDTRGLVGMSNDIYTQLQLRENACIENLQLVGARVEGNVDFGGHFVGTVDLSSAIVGGQLFLAGSSSTYSSTACVLARGMRADTIVYDLSDKDGKPAITDMFGADYRIMRASAPGPSLNRDWSAIRSALGQFLGGAGQVCSESGGVVHDGSAVRQTYQPAIYDALATGFERTGALDIARRIRIIKNQDYADALDATGGGFTEQVGVWATKAVYYFADIISGYGYDNLKAVVWLVGITAIGVVLAIVNDLAKPGGNSTRAQPAVDVPQSTPPPPDPLPAISDVAPDSLQPLTGELGLVTKEVASIEAASAPKSNEQCRAGSSDAVSLEKDRREASWLGRGLSGLAFSLDRSIPNLALDQDFGRHASLGLRGAVSGWFYLQRFLSFFIVLLMVAGAFQVFQ